MKLSMKTVVLGGLLALGLGLAAHAQYAPGQQLVSPANTPGQFPYTAGPQISAVNANGGTLTCSAGGATVANTKITANSIVLMTLKTQSGTLAALFIATITPGTGFTVTCGGSDASTYNYLILG